MTRGVPTSPAWYRDPDDPVRLRHWDGRAWEGPRRRAPAWTLGTTELAPQTNGRRDGDPVLEGPVHPAALPATATAGAQYAGNRPNLLTRGRPSGPQHSSRPGGPAPHWPGAARPVRRASLSRPRAAVMTVCALIALAVVVLAVTVGIAPQRTSTTILADDTGFIGAANQACGESMGAIRLAPTAGISPSGTSTVASVAAIAAANADLNRLADRIRALPLDAGAQAQVFGWLVQWSTFAADRSLWAASAARTTPDATATGTSNTNSPLLTKVALAAADADQFATTNGLTNCTLTPGTNPLTAT